MNWRWRVAVRRQTEGQTRLGRGRQDPGLRDHQAQRTVRLAIVPDRKYATLREEIRRHTRAGSLYYTDDYEVYAYLTLRGEHVVVRKELGRPKGRGHINGIEGFWSYAKHWLYQYRGIHRKFFHLCLAEISFRFNHRDQDIMPLIEDLLKETEYADIANV